MILTPAETRAVLARRKTMVRLPVASRDGVTRRCPVTIGSSHAVQPGAGEPAAAQIAIVNVRREPAGAITPVDAKAEGNRTVEWWKQAWVRRHDAAWMKREHVELADVFGDDVVPFILLKRFEERWAHVEVWVVSFWLDEVKPSYLAPGNGYTSDGSRSVDSEHRMVTGRDGLARLRSVPIPVADPEYVARKAREDHAQAKADAASFVRTEDADRFERARVAAEERGLPTDGASKLVRRAAAALERAVESVEAPEAA